MSYHKSTERLQDERISVIVPVYNVEKYLRQCLDSIVCQTYKNLEILLIDDGSTDNSGKICDEYEKRDNRIRVIHKACNEGPSAARNVGLEIKNGSYVVFMDADDFVPRDYIEVLSDNMTDDVDMVVCEMKGYLPNGRKAPRPNKQIKEEIVLDALDIRNFNEEYRHGWACGWMYRASCARELRFAAEYYWGEDSLFRYSVLKKCRKIRYTNKTAYCYVQYPESASRGSYSEKMYTCVYAWRDVCRLYDKWPVIRELCTQQYVLSCHAVLRLMRNTNYNDTDKIRVLKHEIRRFLPEGLRLRGYGYRVLCGFVLDALAPECICVPLYRWRERLRKREEKKLLNQDDD